MNALKSWDFNICAVFLLDTHFVLDCDKFLGGALTTLSTMIALEVIVSENYELLFFLQLHRSFLFISHSYRAV